MNDSGVDFLSPSALQGETIGVETGLDRTHAYVLIDELASAWKEKERLDVLVLRAICRLSVKHPERASEGFSSLDIVPVVGKLRGRPWSAGSDKNQMSDDVRRNWNKLTATWESKFEGIAQSLTDDKFDLLPELEKTEGGGTGRQSLYRIEWRLCDEQSTTTTPRRSTQPLADPARDIRYICEDIEDANAFSRIFTRGLELTGWKKAAYVIAIGAPLLFGWLFLVQFAFGMTVWAAVGGKNVITSILSLLVIYWAAWATMGPLYTLPTSKIVVGPWWMQSIDDDRLLEHRYPPRFPKKSIKAVRYTAVCPICGGKVSAKSGGFEFWRRIIGRCEDAPVEHVFSFDHVSRSGYALRNS
jgi:hypothetical protein